MKTKIEKTEKVVLSSRKTKVTKVEVGMCDEAYRQVNQESFHENFKVLIGHFTAEASPQLTIQN